jgi:hypothetical protein
MMKSKIIQMNTESKLKHLKSYLKYGDAAIIARVTGYSYHTIRAMVKGDRTMHPIVLEAIEKLVDAAAGYQRAAGERFAWKTINKSAIKLAMITKDNMILH